MDIISRDVFCDYCETGGDHSNEECPYDYTMPGGIDNDKMEQLISIKEKEHENSLH